MIFQDFTYDNYDALVIKWQYKQTEGIYFAPGIEYSKAESDTAHESERASDEIQDKVRMQETVWWLIWNRSDSTNALTASIRYR